MQKHTLNAILFNIPLPTNSVLNFLHKCVVKCLIIELFQMIEKITRNIKNN